MINNYHYNPPQPKREKEGKIKVEKIKPGKKGFDKGDFIDYEEIK